jgi:putative transcriptional regulator
MVLWYKQRDMIQIHVSQLLGKRRIKIAELSRQTGISQHALLKLCHEKTEMVRLDTLERTCQALNCQVANLVEYVKDEPQHI